jgi:hypothetical protein
MLIELITQVRNSCGFIGYLGRMEWASMLRELNLTGGTGKKTANSTPMLSFGDVPIDRVLTSAMTA